MVVLCPNCGREIFSDPDYCVLCGWKRDETPQPGRAGGRETGYHPPASRQPRYSPRPARNIGDTREGAPMRNYPGNRPPTRYNEAQRPPPQPRYETRSRGGYGERYRDEPDDRRRAPPRQGRAQGPYYDDDRYPSRRQERPPPRVVRSGYRDDMQRAPPQTDAGPGRKDINTCPNCGREIFTDPDNCVLCGWSREKEEMRRPAVDERRRRDYREAPPDRYRDTRYRDEPLSRARERSSRDDGDRNYRSERNGRAPPDDWERRVDERVGGRKPRPGADKQLWYKPRTQTTERDRFACDNCGNPSLQFFADGLGRCPGCGQRFRYSPRPVSPRGKQQKHKQFVCSKCDSKNLQFFLDGTGVCPHCKREFKWKK